MTSGPAPTRRARVVVHGLVQGVFFRGTCRREAESVGVAGWVRNTADGAVEAVFEGPAGAVGRMVDWCRTGPSGAHVSDVDVHEESPAGLADFTVEA